MIMAVWSAGMNKFFGGHVPADAADAQVAGAFPLTHLWFLYQLLLLYVGGDRDALVHRAHSIARTELRCFVDATRHQFAAVAGGRVHAGLAGRRWR